MSARVELLLSVMWVTGICLGMIYLFERTILPVDAYNPQCTYVNEALENVRDFLGEKNQ